MKLKPYPEYRDSGVPWLGEIPAHWVISSLRRLARVQLSNVDKHTTEGEVPVRLCNYTDVYHRNSITPDVEFMEASALPREIEKFGLREGDILITKDSESWTDIAVPAYVETDLPNVLCGYHLAQIRPHSGTLKGEYLFRAFQAEPIAYQFRVAASGVTRYGLSSGGIATGMFPLPPQTEQEVIVRFLGRVDRLVNRLIRAKQRLIELLNEEKQAIIHRAVTRGLDPDAPMKSTSLDWLPEVPEHWKVSSLGRFITLQRGIDITKDIQNDGQIPVVSSGGIHSYHDRSTSSGPGVLVGRKGSVGTVYFIESDYWAHDTTLWVARFGGNNPKFVYYVLNQLDLQRFDTGSANPTINRNIVHPEPVAFPPPEEQKEIAFHLDEVSLDTEKAIRRARREIELIREYRMRLISDVVIGKLDVREAELSAVDKSEGEEVREAAGTTPDRAIGALRRGS